MSPGKKCVFAMAATLASRTLASTGPHSVVGIETTSGPKATSQPCPGAASMIPSATTEL